MPNATREQRSITEEIAYRTGFLEGARAALEWIPKFLDRGIDRRHGDFGALV